MEPMSAAAHVGHSPGGCEVWPERLAEEHLSCSRRALLTHMSLWGLQQTTVSCARWPSCRGWACRGGAGGEGGDRALALRRLVKQRAPMGSRLAVGRTLGTAARLRPEAAPWVRGVVGYGSLGLGLRDPLKLLAEPFKGSRRDGSCMVSLSL